MTYQRHSERELDVEEQPPRVAPGEHVASIDGAGRSETQSHGVVAQSLAAFVDEEDVIDELHGQSLAHASAKALDDAAHHQRGKGVALRAADETSGELRPVSSSLPVARAELTARIDMSITGRRPIFR